MDAPRYELLALHGSDEIGRWSLAPGRYTLGRSSECSISLEAEGVADEHAQLSISDDGAIVLEVGLAGASVEGSSVTGAVRVQPDQYIDLGSVSLIVQASSASQNVSLADAEAEHDELPAEFRQPERYEIGAEIAKGGMGAILHARQSTIRRAVAIKIILGRAEEDPWQRLRFIEEAQITGQLEHPNIVPVHDAGLDGQGRVYYTMKLVKGITLKKVLELLKKETATAVAKYPLPTLLTIYQKVCDAVAFAHSKGVIHRDLKPENIMIGAYGEVLVMDWGLARLFRKRAVGAPKQPAVEEIASSRFDRGDGYSTMAGSIMGTPAYMAPEQARGELEQLDQRSDLFALGVILYEILTLARAFPGKGGNEILANILSGTPPLAPATFSVKGDQKAGRPRLLHLQQSTVPESLSAVAMRALQFEPEDRYQHVEALQADLTAYQNGFATTAERAGAWKQVKLLIRRHKATSLGVLAVLLTGLGFGSKVIVERNRAEREYHRANAALAALKESAPALRDLAESEAGFQRFTSAMQKLDAAIALAPEHLPSYWRKAWLYVGMERWDDAIIALDFAGQQDPAHVSLAAVRPTLEKFGKINDSTKWTNEEAEGLLAHLKSVGAKGEVVALVAKLRLNGKAKFELVQARVSEWLGSGVFVTLSADGRITVSLAKTAVDTLEPLKSLPIDFLITWGNIKSLEPLRGMPLTNLEMHKSAISDLSPLKGMSLNRFAVYETPISDISPLTGMPLREVILSNTQVKDLTPLRGAPLERFQAVFLACDDFTPLRGAPLKYFRVNSGHANDLEFLRDAPIEVLYAGAEVKDLTPLRGKPLVFFSSGLKYCSDLTPLEGAPLHTLELGEFRGDLNPVLSLSHLERIAIYPRSDLEILRKHSSLKFIRLGTSPELPVDQFWAEYDAKQAAAKK